MVDNRQRVPCQKNSYWSAQLSCCLAGKCRTKKAEKSALQVNSIPAFSLLAVGVLRATKANDKLLVTSGA